MNMQNAVQEFHAKHDLPIAIGSPRFDEIMMLRIRLISEEGAELVRAVHQKDMVEVADALGDLMYVVFGTAVAYGLELDVDPDEDCSAPPAFPDSAIEMTQVLHLVQKIGDIADSLEARNTRALQFDLEDTLKLCGFIAEDFGLPLRRIFAEVHRSNMTKPKLDANNKGGKGEGFSPVNLGSILYPG